MKLSEVLGLVLIGIIGLFVVKNYATIPSALDNFLNKVMPNSLENIYNNMPKMGKDFVAGGIDKIPSNHIYSGGEYIGGVQGGYYA